MTFDEAEETLIDWLVGPWELLDEPRPQVVALFALLREVGNGGWDQYLVNSDPDVLTRAEAGALAAGLPEVATLVRRGFAVLGTDAPPEDQDARAELLDALPDGAFAELDDELIAREGEIEAALGRLVGTLTS